MPSEPHIAFLGTARSGLGHLRRIANIARRISERDPRVNLSLITNAEPKGLGHADLAPFRGIIVCETAQMCPVLVRSGVSLAVADTMTVPGMQAFAGAAALILRETPPERLARFWRDDGKGWDLVLVPNSPDHWWPDLPEGFARRLEATGWVRRNGGAGAGRLASAGLVLATGGGGNAETRAALYPLLTQLFERAQSYCDTRLVVRQALGPRAEGAPLPGVAEVFDPGANLDVVFGAADLVVSTAGYNSVLELAATDTPALLVPIPRSLDDQAARVALWGPRLGFGLLPGQVDAAARWLAGQIEAPQRRSPYDLGPDGAARAAALLLEMTCRVS